MSPLFCVDAFANRPFRGNPAGVCLLDRPADPGWMQQLAGEVALSETAFIAPADHGFDLRWFTPKMEVDLCGHATLASAHILWESGMVHPDEVIPFHSRSGVLGAWRDGGKIWLDFPSEPPIPCETPDTLGTALGVPVPQCFGNRLDRLVVLAGEPALRELAPDFVALSKIDARGVIVTAPSESEEFDFVSRYFAPAVGIDEDPVTGSAHCALGPFWAGRLGKDQLTGYQASMRGGVVNVLVRGNRVDLGGHAVTVWKGAVLATVTRQE